MVPSRCLALPTLAVVAVLATCCDGQVESWLPLLRPDPYFEFMYVPIITLIMRSTELLQGIARSYKAFLGRRRRSLDSPSVDEAGDPCDLRVPCLALKAMDAGTLDQWVEERWPAAAGKWRSQPQLAKLLERLEQLQREELPHSRQLRRRACQVVLQRCPAS
ncbi:uncharacterized protein LOC122371029 isoform X1 [Amphibalanus amphitrite]|uniref:uncharacterized protein LOC122371029 isoform X1 n=1 Tax=Amphibalanus amphitrite TaxID=1232801 RepID=UPI001C91A8A8|nr:uncharacterized protein LOC122371029 isoform X1 [Amphibalanus amphitrite]